MIQLPDDASVGSLQKICKSTLMFMVNTHKFHRWVSHKTPLVKLITKKSVSYFWYYSVFKIEGVNVKGYYTAKKLIPGAVKGFIRITRMGHFIICIRFNDFCTLKHGIWELVP